MSIDHPRNSRVPREGDPLPQRAVAGGPSLGCQPVPAGGSRHAGRGAPLRVLVACEFSGVVRRAFRERGHEAWSCDLLPAEDGSPYHIQGDAIQAAYGQPWDILIAHPECTYLSNSGAKHLYAGMKAENGPAPERWARMGAAAAFFLALWNAPVPHVAVENPVMLGHPRRLFGIPDPTQTVQPWWFGHGETKATCLWLKNLRCLQPTRVVDGREQRMFRMAPGPNRKQDRSRTYPGFAEAMAEQWSAFITETAGQPVRSDSSLGRTLAAQLPGGLRAARLFEGCGG